MHRMLLAAACLAATVLSAVASAQPPGGRGRGMGMGMGGMSQASLLRQEAVQAELALTADQKSKLATMLPERGPGGGAGGGNPRDMTAEQRQKWMEERRAQAAEDNKKIAGLLDAKQAARLGQIRVQALGAGVLMDETLAKELAVTDDQVSKLQSAMRDMRQGGGGGGNPGEMRAKMMAKAMEILSAEQKAKLETLKGAPFDVSKLQMRGPGGGRPGAGN